LSKLRVQESCEKGRPALRGVSPNEKGSAPAGCRACQSGCDCPGDGLRVGCSLRNWPPNGLSGSIRVSYRVTYSEDEKRTTAMRAQRIKTGFHRVGIMLVIICLVPATITLGLGLLLTVGTGTDNYWLCTATSSHTQLIFVMGVAWLIAATTAYPLARGIGWAVTGFIGDGPSN
jgi:hypothetical protein